MTKRKFLLLCFLLTLGIVGIENVSAQTARLSFNMVNKTVKEVLDEVEKQSDFVFFYSDGTVDLKKTVTLEVKDQPVDQVLNRLFAGSDNTYTIKNRQVYINKKAPAPEPETSAKSIELSGVVISGTDNQPVIGASVFIEGTGIGTMTDVNGEYTLSVSAATKEITFQYMGYITLKLAVKDRNLFRLVTLYEDSQSLDEVTVVAFGKQKKSSVISSIETVKMSDLKVPAANLTGAFAGKIPGIISYQTSGEPGADNAQFFVRGVTTFGYKTSPLILIDGFEATSNDLARMQPDDIESFSILKDASATALYGARGANGIILVNTKPGKEGPVKINARMDMHVATPTRLPKMMDGVDYMRLYNEAQLTRSPEFGTFYSEQKIQSTLNNENPMAYPNVDWYNELFNNSTVNTKLNLNVSGGGGVATYYVAGGYDNETGLLKVDNLNNFNNNINIDRFHIRSNVIFKLTPTTTLDTRIQGRFERYTGPYNSASDIFNMVMNTNPVDFPAIYQPDAANLYTQHHLFGSTAIGATPKDNPYAEMVRGYEDRNENTITAQATLIQNLDFITKGLKLQGKASVNNWNYYSGKRSYKPYYYTMESYNQVTQDFKLYNLNPTDGSPSMGDVEPYRDATVQYYFEARLNWERSFDKHNVGVMTVGMAQENLITGGNSGDIFETLPERNLGNSGRISYDYDTRYFLEFNYGYNGSEKFTGQKQFGFFPSFGAGWLVSNEAFWASLKDKINTLKLKFTYGLVGNDAISERKNRFWFLSNVASGGNGYTWGEQFNGTYTGYTIDRYANLDMTWEVSQKYNLGLELGLFKDESLKLQIDIFRDIRDRIYGIRSSFPNSAGLEAGISGNAGKVQSQGIDASLDYQHFFNKDFWLTGRVNFTFAQNEYLKVDEKNFKDRYLSKIGQNINQQWGYIAERLFVDQAEIDNSPRQDFGKYEAGDIKYKDVNGDGIINANDMVPIGYPTVPEIQYGFGMSSGYKNVDFSFFFQGNARVSFFINPEVMDGGSPAKPTGIAPFANGRRNALAIVAESYWSETNPNVHAFWPRLSVDVLSNNTQSSTWWLRDASFLRLKSLELGYTVRGIKKLHLQDSRIYLSAENLFVISPFKMWDPEQGRNGLGYPIQRRFNVGIQLAF